MNISSLPPALLPTTGTTSDSTKSNATVISTLSSLTLDKSSAGVAQETVQERRQAALTLVDRTLTAAYEKISSRGKSGVDAYKQVEPLTAEKVASNILGFIERRLQMDEAEGATQEQLQSRLEAGLSGFKKGFADASEQLKSLSMLSPEVAADIGQTNELVLKGIDELRSKFITSTTQPPVDAPVTANPAAVKSSSTKPAPALQMPNLAGANVPRQSNYDYASASQFSFQLTTAEGDKVTINASASMGMSAADSAKGYELGISSSQAMNFSVEGDLSDAELKAINDLLGRVNDLAGQFFAGNLDEAFNRAVSLGYDQSQIANFALDLTKVEIQQVPDDANEIAAETSTSQQSAAGLVSLSEQLFPLGNFIKDLLDAIDIPSAFAEPEALLTDASKNMIGKDEDGKQQADRFNDFVKGILALELGQTTDKAAI